jgi:hypothetical protein
MQFDNIDQIYVANDAVREELRSILDGLDDASASKVPDGEKWSAAHLVEHVSIVEEGIGKICSKLLSRAKAEGLAANGVKVSIEFLEKGREMFKRKLEAPSMVVPSGNVPLAESFARMSGNRTRLKGLKPEFESLDGTSHTFPHPYFGELTAVEWLVLVGEHEKRHLRQLKKLLEKT